MTDTYVGFRIALYLLTFVAVIGTFSSWATKDYDTSYYYQNRKSGWWCLAWFGFLIFQSEFWSM